MSLIKFKVSDSSQKRGNYKLSVNVKLNSHLLLKDEDHVKLTNLLENNAPGVIQIQWDLSSDDHIKQRDQFLRENGLNIDSDNIRCKWSIRHSNQTMIVKQCISGSYRKKVTKSNPRISTARYPYVGCLAFVVLFLRNNEICAITGYLEHSGKCKTSQPQRDPPYRLLPFVKKSAENLLNLNVSTTNILAQNAQIVKNVFGKNTLIGNYRTLLTAMDIANIKKEMLQKNWNIDIRNDAARNLEKFLGSSADQSELKAACLHYQPHTNDTDRLEIIICTPEQQEYAWKYGHQNLILVDGTFGISKHKLLLFIIMVIDEKNKGIPITFILFTPPINNRLTSSGYDSKILERLFTIFRDKLSITYNQNQLAANPNATLIIFTPIVAMTDTDVKERGPLSKVWPGIILLLCYFHISQCWKNEITKQLGRGGDSNTVLQRQTLKVYLRNILKEAWSMDGEEDIVRKFITEKKESLKDLISKVKVSESKNNILHGGVKFLTYLEKQWAGNLLYSWCLNGRKRAANALGVPLEKLPTTNNHLERINEYLKNNQLKRFQRNGRLLRADVLYVALVSEIIPNIFALRDLTIDLEKEKAERRKEFNIMDPSTREILMREFPQIAYFAPSPNRDESAKSLFQMKKVIGYEIEKTGKLYVRVESETTPQLIYTTCVYGQPTDICCQCPDFLQNGILCKHLRAAAFYIEDLRKQEQYAYLPAMIFATQQEARNILRNLCANKFSSSENTTTNNNNDSDNRSVCDYRNNSDNEDDGDDGDDDDDDDNNNDNSESDIDNNFTTTSSSKVLGYMEHILGMFNTSAKSLTIDTPTQLNTTAIYKQEFDDFLVSTSKCMQKLQENSEILLSLLKSKQPSIVDTNQQTLATYLHDIVNSNSFKQTQHLVNIMHEGRNPRKHTASVAGIVPLARETKQRRHPSYSSL